jgi:phosphopantothenoylcysteine decarboxylase/phosphopantothenate--cysteine ligase
MHFVVTAGPTFEPLDRVRRLTNFSTGQLGMELAFSLAQRGHKATLLLSEQAVYRRALRGVDIIKFTTTASLRDALLDVSTVRVDAVFHAAAVCDFTFGNVWRTGEQGEQVPVEGGKISTRDGTLVAELLPTPKLIAELRDLFPDSWLVGWKYEVDGDRGEVIAAAEQQIRECRTSGCVANGPAYGEGFGLILNGGRHIHAPDTETLARELLRTITS